MSAPGAAGLLGRVLYWFLVAVLVLVGALFVFSVGPPLIVAGIALAAMYPIRGRRRVFWPAMLAVVGFLAAWWLLAPVSCRSGGLAAGGEGTECVTVTGLEYGGRPLWIGPLGGLAAAGALGTASYLALRASASRARD